MNMNIMRRITRAEIPMYLTQRPKNVSGKKRVEKLTGSRVGIEIKGFDNLRDMFQILKKRSQIVNEVKVFF